MLRSHAAAFPRAVVLRLIRRPVRPLRTKKALEYSARVALQLANPAKCEHLPREQKSQRERALPSHPAQYHQESDSNVIAGIRAALRWDDPRHNRTPDEASRKRALTSFAA